MKILWGLVETTGVTGERKYNAGLFSLTLAFILALFGDLNEISAKCIVSVYAIVAGGNVFAKAAKVLPNMFSKRGE